MAIKAHNFDLNIESLAEIEKLLPRLKHSVLSTKVIRWLENFNPEDVELAKDLLRVYEYITFEEFMYRLDDLFKNILSTIPEGEKILIIPFGKIGKSATLVTYPLKKTTAYLKREDDITLSQDYQKVVNPKQFKHLIFLDDFIGSGKTFCTDFTKKDSKGNSIELWVKKNKIKNLYILATITMVKGKEHIKSKFDIRIEADERNKIFDKTNSPLIPFGNLPAIEDMNEKYGSFIKVFGKPPFVAPRGYSKSESLVSFFHCTPNNTLTIIWGKNSTWTPLFPREAKIRMDEAREFKKEVAFYIGICNRLGIDIYDGSSIMEKKGSVDVRRPTHNTKQDHALISLLVLKNQGYEDILICHILGLTIKELDDIYKRAAKLGYTNKEMNLTKKGKEFIIELKQKTKSENFREATPDRLIPKDEIYIPKNFKRKDII